MLSVSFIVLTAAPGTDAITERCLEAVREAAGPYQADGERWLAPSTAWEMRLQADLREPAAVRAAIKRAIGSAPIDVNVISSSSGPRRKRLLCADMESTIIREELIDEMADIVGCRAEISAITEAAMRGNIDFEGALVKRVALFKGLAADRLNDILNRATLMPGAVSLIHTMAATGAKCALVSGGFTVFAHAIAQRLGFDAVVANELVIENGTLTGEVKPPIVGPGSKADVLVRLAAEQKLDRSDTLAVGDGANDLLMLRAAGLGVAFRAKPILAFEASSSVRGAVVSHGDLTALLHLQGIPQT